MRRTSTLLLLILVAATSGCSREPASLLIFSKTSGYRHQSIEAGLEALKVLGVEKGFTTTATEDASLFTDEYLGQFDAIIFLCTTGDIFDPGQQLAMQRYIEAGGGYVGIHSATDTEYDWPWYGQLAGGYFAGHPGNPNVREGRLLVADANHPSTSHLPEEWIRTDEWYDIRDQYSEINVLLNIDESTYKKPEENPAPAPRPIAWYHDFDGGRAFYSALGHTSESWQEPDFVEHIWGGIQYAVGSERKRRYESASVVPPENRFAKSVLDQNLNEPMELDFLDDRHIVFVERGGAIKVHSLESGETTTVATVPVSTFGEEGLLGIAVDPAYGENHWIYLAYSDPEVESTHLSRFDFDGRSLDPASEKRMLSIPVDRGQACCHMGGSLEFDAEGNLYLSVGDNTNPFQSDSFDPIDERPGRRVFDAQRSSGNSMDLRGKILRITPNPDGSYAIPDGNLFPDNEKARPEIYVMGNRNPFRISIDSHTGFLYWGEVGPDASDDGEKRGPRGYDEINQARTAGFFGWPFVIANNIPYFDFNFSNRKSGSKFDVAGPENDSPNNGGLKQLPPAQPAFIWYPYNKSDTFPSLGSGGRTAMAGPVYHPEDFPETDVKFPDYYRDRLIVYDWIRDWMASVKMDADGNLVRVDRFLESTLDLSNPMDMLFGPDGSLFILEYGEAWNQRNLDARLSRITFNAGNRIPDAELDASTTVGGVPLTVNFSADGSADPDGDGLQYEWDVDGNGTVDSKTPAISHTYDKPGTYTVVLIVRDKNGGEDRASAEIWVGNAPPETRFNLSGNQTFYFDNDTRAFDVSVTDLEDGSLATGSIDVSRVTTTISFVPQGQDLVQPSVGHQSVAMATGESIGEKLIAGSDCLSCHQTKLASNGPAFAEVANRYAGSPDAREYLIDKVISGGGGVWGDRAMAAHPNLSPADAARMVDYIRSLATAKGEQTTELGTVGKVKLDRHTPGDADGRYVLTTSYSDRGANSMQPLTSRDQIILRSPVLEAERLDRTNGLSSSGGLVFGSGRLSLDDVDLTGVQAIQFVPGSGARKGTIIVRLHGSDENEIARIDLAKASGNRPPSVPITVPAGIQQISFEISGLVAGSAGLDKIVLKGGGR